MRRVCSNSYEISVGETTQYLANIFQIQVNFFLKKLVPGEQGCQSNILLINPKKRMISWTVEGGRRPIIFNVVPPLEPIHQYTHLHCPTTQTQPHRIPTIPSSYVSRCFLLKTWRSWRRRHRDGTSCTNHDWMYQWHVWERRVDNTRANSVSFSVLWIRTINNTTFSFFALPSLFSA